MNTEQLEPIIREIIGVVKKGQSFDSSLIIGELQRGHEALYNAGVEAMEIGPFHGHLGKLISNKRKYWGIRLRQQKGKHISKDIYGNDIVGTSWKRIR